MSDEGDGYALYVFSASGEAPHFEHRDRENMVLAPKREVSISLTCCRHI
jgi:hypothetical protein